MGQLKMSDCTHLTFIERQMSMYSIQNFLKDIAIFIPTHQKGQLFRDGKNLNKSHEPRP